MKYNLDPSVIARLVNILQESMLTGMDISALYSELELEESDPGSTKLVMTQAYEAKVVKELARLEQKRQEILASLPPMPELPANPTDPNAN